MCIRVYTRKSVLPPSPPMSPPMAPPSWEASGERSIFGISEVCSVDLIELVSSSILFLAPLLSCPAFAMEQVEIRSVAMVLGPFLMVLGLAMAAMQQQWTCDRVRRYRLQRVGRYPQEASALSQASFATSWDCGDDDDFSLYAPLLGGSSERVPRPRRWWVQERMRRTWWTNEVLATWDNDQWLYHFRMAKATLFEIGEHLHPHLERRTTKMREPIPVEERVAIAVWWLTTPVIYRKTANTFGLGISTVAEIAIEVCLAIEHVLLSSTVCLGDYQRLQIMDSFHQMGFPQCIGEVDGTHIAIRPPKGRGEEFINCKSSFSILL